MKRWNDYMLKTKLFVSFSVVLLFIVSITCFIFYFKNVSDVKYQTYSMLNTITRQFGRTIDLYMQDIEKQSVSIFGDTTIQMGLLDHYNTADPVERSKIQIMLNQRLFTYAHQEPFVQSIYLFTKDQHVFYVTKAGLPNAKVTLKSESQYLEDTTWYENDDYTYKNKFILLPTADEQVDVYDEEKVISFMRNINEIPSRQIIGYMKINININAFKNMLVHSDINEVERNIRIMVVTDDGYVIYDNKDEWTGHPKINMDKGIFSGNQHTGDMNWNGEAYLYTYEKSGYTNWNTMTLIPNDIILAKQRRTLYIVLAVGLVATLLIAAVSYILAYQITLPLTVMIKKMLGVEVGDFSQRMQVTSNNEIGRLSHIYNNMLDSISRLISEVYESKLAEKNSQLSALQAQINPHFLYNTLNIMKSISRIKGVEEVAEMSESLAQLFQYSMNNLQHPVPLREELVHITNYMKIQHHRFHDRFELQCDVPEELEQASVLKLTVQPLIENAVVHGLEKKKSGGSIQLIARRNDGILTIEITDNGKGMDKTKLFKLQEELRASNRNKKLFDDAHGIGLLNIQERIHLLYGEAFGIVLSSSPDLGTTVKLSLPFISHPNGEGQE